jgi:hypothetical protein
MVGVTKSKGESLKKYEEFKYATQEERSRIVSELEMSELGITPEKWEAQLRQLAMLRGELNNNDLER